MIRRVEPPRVAATSRAPDDATAPGAADWLAGVATLAAIASWGVVGALLAR
jgi:hypothetical protein